MIYLYSPPKLTVSEVSSSGGALLPKVAGKKDFARASSIEAKLGETSWTTCWRYVHSACKEQVKAANAVWVNLLVALERSLIPLTQGLNLSMNQFGEISCYLNETTNILRASLVDKLEFIKCMLGKNLIRFIANNNQFGRFRKIASGGAMFQKQFHCSCNV